MADLDDDAATRAFAHDVRAGLSQPQKLIPARWFYDRRGSALFEQITDLPEYYPTRTEVALLAASAGAIAAAVGPGRTVVEFGSGSSAKTPLLLEAVAPAAYVPIDISADWLFEAAAALGTRFPGLAVHPLAGDFTGALALPAAVAGTPRLGFFPGSTIGNLAPAPAVDLLRRFAALLGAGSWLLIGFDLAKDVAVLEAAYDDAAGVTADFNLNLAARINRELGGSIDTSRLRHLARWNPAASRIEMHLEATRAQQFEAAGGRFSLEAGETIHTENSHKWSLPAIKLMAEASGWTPEASFEDAQGWFSLQLWRWAGARLEP